MSDRLDLCTLLEVKVVGGLGRGSGKRAAVRHVLQRQAIECLVN